MDLEAFDAFTRETRLLFHQLKRAAEVIHHANADLAAGHRGVLESLHRDGRQTVPALARARPVSRQHIQLLVNRLLELGLVEIQENPATKRSPFIALTQAGKSQYESMRKREARVLSDKRLPRVSARDLTSATDTLRRVREFLAAEFPGEDE